MKFREGQVDGFERSDSYADDVDETIETPEPVPGRRSLLDPRHEVFRLKANPGKRSRTVLASMPGQQSRGESLPEAARARLERSLSARVDHVRIHADASANQLAENAGALALARGADIYFAAGAYDPESPAGFELLAHEVQHTLQAPAVAGEDPASAESEADRAAALARRQFEAEATARRLAPAFGLLPNAVSIDTSIAAVQRLAARSARGLLTAQTIVLDPRRVDPTAPEGEEIVAHELAHAAQSRLPVKPAGDPRAAEREARSAASAVIRGESPGPMRVPIRHDAADSDSAEEELVDLVEDHYVKLDGGVWKVRLTFKGAPADHENDEDFLGFADAVSSGLSDAIERASDLDVKRRSFKMSVKYRRGRDLDQVQRDAEKKAAKQIARLVKKGGSKTKATKEPADEQVEVEAPRDPVQAERESAVQAVVAHLKPHRHLDTQIEVSFYYAEGAVTLLGTRRIKEGTKEVDAVSLAPLADELRENMQGHFMGPAHYVTYTFQLEKNGWSVPKRSSEPARGRSKDEAPGEARTIAIDQTAYNDEAKAAAKDAASQITSYAISPPSTVQVEIVLEDDRLVSTNLVTSSAKEGGGSSAVTHGDSALKSIAEAILPYTRGLGERTLSLEFDVGVSGGQSVWTVLASGTRLPAEDWDDEGEQIVKEYRKTHEEIMVQWRKGVRDAGVMAAGIAIEHVAANLIAGGLGKVLGWAAGKFLPKLAKLLGKKTQRQQIEWVDTALRRLGKDERQAAQELMVKVETQGAKALSKKDRKRLAALEERLTDMAETALNEEEKDALRRAARSRIKKARAEVIAEFQAAGKTPDVHHKIGLEYAHLFPDKDINELDNLTVLDELVHDRISNVWVKFKKAAKEKEVSADAVKKVSKRIDDEFGDWYDQVVDEHIKGDLLAAEARAIEWAERVAGKL